MGTAKMGPKWRSQLCTPSIWKGRSARISEESRAGGGQWPRVTLNAEAAEAQGKRAAQEASESGAGAAACEAFRILADLVTTSPEAAAAARIGYDLNDPVVTLEDRSGIGVGYQWRGVVYWIYVTFYGAHPPDEDSIGELMVFAGGTLVKGLRARLKPDDAEHVVHFDRVDNFKPGAWTDEIWALVEWLTNLAVPAPASEEG
jgi:hypothetical protein